jgi:hypothetical protein
MRAQTLFGLWLREFCAAAMILLLVSGAAEAAFVESVLALGLEDVLLEFLESVVSISQPVKLIPNANNTIIAVVRTSFWWFNILITYTLYVFYIFYKLISLIKMLLLTMRSQGIK